MRLGLEICYSRRVLKTTMCLATSRQPFQHLINSHATRMSPQQTPFARVDYLFSIYAATFRNILSCATDCQQNNLGYRTLCTCHLCYSSDQFVEEGKAVDLPADSHAQRHISSAITSFHLISSHLISFHSRQERALAEHGWKTRRRWPETCMYHAENTHRRAPEKKEKKKKKKRLDVRNNTFLITHTHQYQLCVRIHIAERALSSSIQCSDPSSAPHALFFFPERIDGLSKGPMELTGDRLRGKPWELHLTYNCI